MAIFGPYTNASVTINSVDLSARAKSVTINYTANMLDASAMGNTTKVNLAGLLDWNVTVEFEQDFAAPATNSVDATLFPLIGAAAFTITILPNGGTPSATNPRFYGSAVLASYNPASGSHGTLLTCQATFQCAGALSRSTT